VIGKPGIARHPVGAHDEPDHQLRSAPRVVDVEDAITRHLRTSIARRVAWWRWLSIGRRTRRLCAEVIAWKVAGEGEGSSAIGTL